MMEKTQTSMYGKVIFPVSNKEIKKKRVLPIEWRVRTKQGFLGLLAFLGGKISIFHSFNPVGIAFLSASLSGRKEYYILAALVAAGFVFGGGTTALPRYILCILLGIIVNFTLGKRLGRASAIQKSALGGAGLLLSGVTYAAANNMSKFLLVSAALESVMVIGLTYVMTRGVALIRSGVGNRIITSEEVISIAIVLAGGVAGAAGITLGGVSIKILLSGIIILVAGYRGGAATGAAMGVLMGFMLLICGEGSAALFCALGVSGMLCGTMRELGRGVTFLSFLLGMASIAFYMDGNLFDRSYVLGVILSGAVLLLPQKVLECVNMLTSKEKTWAGDEYYMRMKAVIEQRLHGFSKAFAALGKTFSSLAEEKEAPGQKDIARLIDDVADKVCGGCGLSDYCWKKNFYNTYQTLFSALSVCEKRGKLLSADVSKGFADNCIKLDSFIETVNRRYEVYKTDLVWRERLEESRDLVSQQLMCVSGVMDKLSGELEEPPRFRDGYERGIRTELKKIGITPERVIVTEDDKERFTADITFRNSRGERQESEMLPIVGRVLGRKMKLESSACATHKDDRCTLRFVEESTLRLSAAAAAVTKENSPVSGDSFSFMEVHNGCYMLAISDAMGSGKQAMRESSAAIELLEQFMEAGFEKDLAIKMINSVLILRSWDDAFATLDICCVDLYSGMAEFVKIGAAAAFLIRDGKALAIRSGTLPVGVLKNVDVEKTNVLLEPEDIILMMTDGAADVIARERRQEDWLEEAFVEFQSRNPEVIAQYILARVQKEAGGQIRDDMTVIAARLWSMSA